MDSAALLEEAKKYAKTNLEDYLDLCSEAFGKKIEELDSDELTDDQFPFILEYAYAAFENYMASSLIVTEEPPAEEEEQPELALDELAWQLLEMARLISDRNPSVCTRQIRFLINSYLIDLLMTQNQFETAINDIEKLLVELPVTKPEIFAALIRLYACYYSLTRREDALKTLKRAYALAEELNKTESVMADLKIEISELEKAIDFYKSRQDDKGYSAFGVDEDDKNFDTSTTKSKVKEINLKYLN